VTAPETRKRVGNVGNGFAYEEPLLFERSRPGRVGYSLPRLDVPEVDAGAILPDGALRDDIPGLPELSEVEVVRHFTRLSTWNASVDLGLYPLGSCTMKYNPKLNETVARLPGFASAHPLQPVELLQGYLHLAYELERHLAEISGMDRISLQPAAGAQGELAGIMMIRAYFEHRGERRTQILVPDSAHGTNPSSAALNGYDVIAVPSGEDGILHPEAIEAVMTPEVAALMVTNPNTLGLFESHIARIAEIVHAGGGLVYGDGANLNALLGIARPGDLGTDVMHFNLHKTFSTPHGGGGPGAGPIGVKNILAPYLPATARATTSIPTSRTQSAACTRTSETWPWRSAPTPTCDRSAPRDSGAAPRWRCSMPTTCSRVCGRPSTCPMIARSCTSACSPTITSGLPA
jgi:glycine dehydrogenase subunit 2